MREKENDKSLKEKYDALEKRYAFMEQIMNHMREAVLMTDTDHRIAYFNVTEAENEGFKTEFIGKKVADMYAATKFSVDDPGSTEDLVLKTGEPVIDQQISYISLKGEQIHSFFSCYPFCYKGKTEGVYTISRPLFSDDLFVNAVLSYEKKLKQNNNQKKDSTHYYLDSIIGRSTGMTEVIKQARKVSQYSMPVLIVGETGTGKEMIAQGIHNEGKTARGDFIAINCAAVPESLLEGILFGVTKGAYTGAVATQGLFEQAENGSIFLDEVNSMPVSLQMKLLRVLQEKRVRPLGGKKEIPVNCRVISSSNIDPFDTSNQQSRQIRADLLYRLASATIHVPALRNRKDDISDLCRHFIHENVYGNSLRLQEVSPVLAEMLRQYEWPGNVRELQNIVYASLLNADEDDRFLEAKHLPTYFRESIGVKQGKHPSSFHPRSLKDAVADYERKVIIDTILQNDGNITKSAKEMKVTRQDLYYKIEKLGIGELLPQTLK